MLATSSRFFIYSFLTTHSYHAEVGAREASAAPAALFKRAFRKVSGKPNQLSDHTP